MESSKLLNLEFAKGNTASLKHEVESDKYFSAEFSEGRKSPSLEEEPPKSGCKCKKFRKDLKPTDPTVADGSSRIWHEVHNFKRLTEELLALTEIIPILKAEKKNNYEEPMTNTVYRRKVFKFCLNIAMETVRNGSFYTCLKVLEKALEVIPSLGHAYLLRSVLYFVLENEKNCFIAIAKALIYNSRDITCYKWLKKLYSLSKGCGQLDCFHGSFKRFYLYIRMGKENYFTSSDNAMLSVSSKLF